ncbi:MAG: tetratricopeptide repeat protein [Spirosomataceae bacterium]
MRKFLFLFIFITGTCVGQEQYQSLLNKTHAQRFPTIYQLGNEESPNFTIEEHKAKIGRIKRMAEEAGDEELVAEMDILAHSHYLYLATASQELLDFIKRLDAVAQKKKWKWLQIKVEWLYGVVYFYDVANYEQAFIHFERLAALLATTSASEIPNKLFFYYQIGEAYYFFSDYSSTIKYLELALQAPPFTQDCKKQLTQTANTIGLCYQKLKQYGKANEYFRKAYEIYDPSCPEKGIWKAITSGNIGYSYYLTKQYQKAKPLLLLDAQSAIDNLKDYGLAVGSLTPLGAIALDEGDVALADKYLSQAKAYSIRSGQYKRYELLYPQLARLAAAKGNTKLASVYLDSALIVKDSLARKFNALQILRAKQKTDLEIRKAELQEFENEKRISRLIRNVLITGLVLLSLVAVWVYRQQTQKVMQKERELEEATQELNVFTQKLTENNQLIESLKQQMGNENTEALHQLQQITILTDAEWDRFRKLFDKVHTGYLLRLKTKYPELSPAEIRFIVLSKLKFSNNEMCSTLGISVDTIRQYKSRLRKKLQLTEDTSLDQLIEHV